MNSNRIKIGQIGIGHNHADEKMATVRSLSDQFEVVGIVETDNQWLEKRGGFEVYKGLPWMTEEELFKIEGLQAVAVETDGFDLIPTAKRCINAGLHIHLDKPGGELLDPFKNLLKEAERNKLTVQMGYMYRNNPAMQFCFKAVKDGMLGEVFEIHTVMSRKASDDYRKWLSLFPGGAMYIFGGHLIDLIVNMLGKPDKISSFQRMTFPEKDSLMDNGLAVLEYSGATVTIRNSVVEFDGFRRRQMVICGDKGTIEIKPIEPLNWKSPENIVIRLNLENAHGKFKAGCQDVVMPKMVGRYHEQLLEFAKIIKGEMAHPYSVEHDLIVQETLLKAAGYINN
jgi:predicted dehydrogenase